jgi:hypothetical protein
VTDTQESLWLQVVHASPGRLRLRVSREAVASGALEAAARSLATMSGIQAARLNRLASSLVIHYDPAALDEHGLLTALAVAGLPLANLEPSEAAYVPGSMVGHSIQDAFQTADERVGHATSGQLDLRTLVPLGFAALVLREILAGRVTAPPWYNLAWWAFDSFYKLHLPRLSEEPPEKE